MIYVRVELWPQGDREKAHLLQEMVIANDGTGTAEVGHYKAAVGHSTTYKGSGFEDPRRPKDTEVWRQSTVRDIDRRKISPLALVAKLLRAAGVS